VRCPVTCIATRSGTPALTMFRTAVRRKSWRSIPGQPALRQAVTQAFRKPGGLAARYAVRQQCIEATTLGAAHRRVGQTADELEAMLTAKGIVLPKVAT
jgi:hypothetical protein